MVRNVSNINPVFFRGNVPSKNQESKAYCTDSIKELNNVTPDFGVKMPQKYTKIGETELSNGLVLHSYKLANGHRVTIIPMEGSPATVKNYVNVGSMNETDDIKGISHFLEHMAFNGTTGENGYEKLETGDSFKKIDRIGGWTNASTNYAITDYVNSSPMLNDKDIDEQIRIMAAMTEDLALTDEMIEKEKNTVCSEINMILDNPDTIAVDQTIRTLFNIKSSADELVGGSTKHIQNLTKERVKEYYDKYYTPDNMNLVITGDVDPDKIMETVAKEFHSNKKSKGIKYEERMIPVSKTVRKDFISDKATSSEIVLGFAGHSSNDAKSEVIQEILKHYIDSEDAGIQKILEEYNAYGNIYSDKISTNPYNPTVNLFNITCSNDNVEIVLKAIFDKLSNLKMNDEKILENIKKRLIMHRNDDFEYSDFVNGIVGNVILADNMTYLTDYEKILDEITIDDVNNYIKEYLNINKSALTVVHPEADNAKNISFKGKNSIPVKTEKLTSSVLDNNCNVVFHDTKNDNMTYNLELKFDYPEGINLAAFEVLSEIYSKGINNQSESDYKKFNQDNNLIQSINLYCNGLSLYGYSDYNNFKLNAERGIELLKNPKINEEEVNKAVKNLKEDLLLIPADSNDLFCGYESKFDTAYYSREELIKALDTLTVDDVKNLHDYIMNNSMGYVVLNNPENKPSIKNTAEDAFSKLNMLKPYEYKLNDVYNNPASPVVITKDRTVSQADIKQVYKFEMQDTPKEKAVFMILNEILSSSDSIGLFNRLRERDHLAYSVYSSTDKSGNCAKLELNILTTTDNKDNGEISYDNLQKSINGFNRQTNLLKNSKYTDEDLESAKLKTKAALLHNEGTESIITNLSASLEHKEGPDYLNIMYEAVDNITREDIDALSARIFSNNPIYAIVASEDTLNANKEFLEGLKNQS